MHLSKIKHSKFNESGQLLIFYLASAVWGADIVIRVSVTIRFTCQRCFLLPDIVCYSYDVFVGLQESSLFLYVRVIFLKQKAQVVCS